MDGLYTRRRMSRFYLPLSIIYLLANILSGCATSAQSATEVTTTPVIEYRGVTSQTGTGGENEFTGLKYVEMLIDGKEETCTQCFEGGKRVRCRGRESAYLEPLCPDNNDF